MKLRLILMFTLLLALIFALHGLADSIANPTATVAATVQTTQVPETTETPEPAAAYVLLTLQSGSYWFALPEEGEVDIPIRQTRTDGEEIVNVLHLTPEGMCMGSSTCENQDCVNQGFVSIEGREDRILGNMIICLPNSVALELYTPDEIIAMYQQQAEQSE